MTNSPPTSTAATLSGPEGRSGASNIEYAIRRANASGQPALATFLTAGYPKPDEFEDALEAVTAESDVVEIGVPFTDPMADGVTIQESSRVALAAGVTVSWILETLGRKEWPVPLVMMSYLNPLLAFGIERLAQEAREAGIDGLIVPDLPYEESDTVLEILDCAGLGLIQLVSPVTPPNRLERLCQASRGFVYAVTTTGTTGGRSESGGNLSAYLGRVRSASQRPVLAGFGIRSAQQVQAVAPFAHGVVVGSALVEVMTRGEDAGQFLRSLRSNNRERY